MAMRSLDPSWLRCQSKALPSEEGCKAYLILPDRIKKEPSGPGTGSLEGETIPTETTNSVTSGNLTPNETAMPHDINKPCHIDGLLNPKTRPPCRKKRPAPDSLLDGPPEKKICSGDIYYIRLVPKKKIKTTALPYVRVVEQFWVIPDPIIRSRREGRYKVNRYLQRKVVWD